MTGKQQDSPLPGSGWCAQAALQVLCLHGRDAFDFLQRQCMNDVTALRDRGQWQWNGMLTPKGRVLALFAALRADDETAWLVLPDGDAAHWAAVLQRLVFRSRLQISTLACSAFGVFGGGPPAQPRDHAQQDADGWLLDMGSTGRERRLRLASTDGLARPPDPDAGEELPPQAWTLENLRHGLPRIAEAQRDRYTPQMLGLERLAAYSVKKGCYPGQEIVARTHFLGQAKRGLVRLGATRTLVVDENVHCGRTDASIVDHASWGAEHCGVAVLPLDGAGESCSFDDGSEAVRLPFLDGLARAPG